MKKIIIAISTFILIAGCSHRADIRPTPSPAKMDAAQEKVRSVIIESQTIAKRLSGSVGRAKASHDIVTIKVDALEPKVIRFQKTAPPDLRPFADTLVNDVQAIQGEQANGKREFAALDADKLALMKKLEDAMAKQAAADKERDDYKLKAVSETDRANAAETAWQKDSRQIVTLVEHNILFIVLGLFVLAGVGTVIFLKFAGKTAVVAAEVASKVP